MKRNRKSLRRFNSLSPPSTKPAERSGESTQPKLGIEQLTLEKIKTNNGIKLNSLVNELTGELHYDRDRVIGRLIELESQGKLALKERTPYRSFASFATSPASLLFWLALAVTFLSAGLIEVTNGVALYLKYAFGGLLILYLPGYSLIDFLYAKSELDQLVRIALSIGLSLAITPLIGLALNYTLFGIRLVPVVISLVLFTSIFLILSLKRKHTYYKLANDIV